MAKNIELLTRGSCVLDAWRLSLVHDSMGSKRQDASEADIVDRGGGCPFSVDSANRAVLISPFELIVRGRQARLATASSISLGFLAGIKYVTVYALMNLVNGSAQVASIEIDANAGGYSTLQSDDPTKIEFAELRAPLFRFIWNASGPNASDLTQVARFIEPGEAFRTKSLQYSSTIDGNLVSDLVRYGAPVWNNARLAKVAASADLIRDADLYHDALLSLKSITIKPDEVTIPSLPKCDVGTDMYWIQETTQEKANGFYYLRSNGAKDSEYELVCFVVQLDLAVAYKHIGGLFDWNEYWDWRFGRNTRKFTAVVRPGGKLVFTSYEVDGQQPNGIYMIHERYINSPSNWETLIVEFPSRLVYTREDNILEEPYVAIKTGSATVGFAWTGIIKVTPIVRKK